MKVLMVRRRSGGRSLRLSRIAWKLPARQLGFVLLTVSLAGIALAQGSAVVVERDGRVISLVPYAPNILRVTMSNAKTTATGAAGYGFVATPSTEGWTHEPDAEGVDVFRSPRMVVRLAPGNPPAEKLTQPMQLDDSCDRISQGATAPGGLRQPPCMEVGVDRYVLAVPRGRGQQGVELDELDRLLIAAAMFQPGDGAEDLLVAVASELGRDLRFPPHDGKFGAVVLVPRKLFQL